LTRVDHLVVKAVHQSTVVLSISGFFARGLGSLAGAAWTQGRLAKTVPHVIDTLLLGSALTLAWSLRLSPLAAPWLMAKILGLLLYIGLGMVALKPDRPQHVRAAAWLAALAVFGWIVSVAMSKNALGLLALR
jgi:uncharacterized membrane protein SirB2